MTNGRDGNPENNGLTRCTCRLTDCHFYRAVDDPDAPPDACDCAHPEKPFYMADPCPLYRKDWRGGRDEDEIRELRDRFGGRRSF